MTLPDVPILKQRINQLIQDDKYGTAGRAVESFTNRWARLNQCIHQLPFDDQSAFACVMYAHLEKVLMRFEEIEWLGPQSGPVLDRHKMSDALHAFDVRSERIYGRLERLPVEKKLATSAVLHGELEAALLPFERHRWVQKQRVKQNSTPPLRWRWN